MPGTDPAFTGAADELQLRLRGDARGLRLRFVRALPHAPTPRARARARQARRTSSRARAGAPTRCRRAPARATAPSRSRSSTTRPARSSTRPRTRPGIVLGIARYHRDSNRWNDIGYNFLVDRYGVIFEGRAGGIDAAVIGAQAQGYNSQSTGIATLGTFTNLPLDEPAMEALAKLIGWKLSIHGIPTQGTVTLISGGGETNRYPSGTPVTLRADQRPPRQQRDDLPGRRAVRAAARPARPRRPLRGPDLGAHRARRRASAATTPVAVSGQLRFADGSSPAGAPLAVEYTTAGAAWTPVTTTAAGPRRRLGGERRAPGHRAGPRGVRRRRRSRPARIGADQRPRRAEHDAHGRQARARRPARRSRSPARSRPRSRSSSACSSARSAAAGCTVQRKRIDVHGGRYATKVRRRRAGLYRVSIIADGVTRRRTLRALR